MLAIVSDIHLTDDAGSTNVKQGAFKVFRERLSDLAYDASWREDGTYRPIEQLDVLLLGDILDVIRSPKWPDVKPDHPNHVRPWSDRAGDDAKFVKMVSKITASILRQNKDSLAVLKSLGRTGTTIPKARAGKPVANSYVPQRRRRVKVRIHYMVGNHDWFYHLPGRSYDRIRRTVVDAMGLANPHSAPFPHRPAESGALLHVLTDHGVCAQHGDVYDPYNYDADAGRDASSLGDVIVVELVNRFPAAVKNKPGLKLPADCIEGLKEIDNVRPITLIPFWIQGLLNRTGVDHERQRQVKKVWNRMVDDFLDIPFVKAHDSWRWFEPVDKLETLLRISQAFSIKRLGKAASRFDRSRSYYADAAGERALKDRMARYVVYGHSHHPEVVPHDLIPGNGEPMEQVYLNTGTWRRVHQLAKHAPDQLEFITTQVMTYLAFFKDDERKGRPFEAWTGVLAVG